MFLRLRTPVFNRSNFVSFSSYRIKSRSICSVVLPFEEEQEPCFEKFYPITLGEIINEKYKVMAKLGFGSVSTLWCCRNLSTNKYAALKIYAYDLVGKNKFNHETSIYKQLRNAESNHPGKTYVRTIQDSFIATSKAGNSHQCLVHEVLSNDILSLRYTHPQRKLNEELLKQFLIHLLLALDFLRTECHVIHTDIKEENVLLSLVDSTILEQFDTKTFATSSFYKSINGYNLYRSINFGIPKDFGRPILCDFSLAQNGQVENSHDIQPDPYRAPEVILEIPWSYSVDVWNVGVMIWDMFSNKRLFDTLNPKTGLYENRFHLASMVGLLGPPPGDFLERSLWSGVYFDERGNWKCVNPVQPTSWEEAMQGIEVRDKNGFLDFMRKMITWEPESRANTNELLQDPWLLGLGDGDGDGDVRE